MEKTLSQYPSTPVAEVPLTFQLLQRAAERYRGMQDFWLKQLNRGKIEVLDNESSQARLGTFRKIAGKYAKSLTQSKRTKN